MHPDWLAPTDLPAGVGAVFTTRAGGVSCPPWSGLNLGDHVGDDPAAVAENRRRLAAALGVQPVFLRQVHGCGVVRLDARSAPPIAPGQLGPESPATRGSSAASTARPAGAEPTVMQADACWTTEPGLACCILVADCLPVLLAAPEGRGVAAAHAGWRGLAAGVLEATAQALAEGAGCRVADLRAWLGPCIAQADFEVGPDVLQAFGVPATSGLPSAPGRFTPGRPGRWQADLAGLALDRLATLGVASAGPPLRRTDDPALYSYRRQGVTGRFAGCIWLR